MSQRRQVRLECRTVVLDEHTLGVAYPNGLQILRASILRGSPHPGMGLIAFDPLLNTRWRSATEQDFNEFGVMFNADYLTPTEVPTFLN